MKLGEINDLSIARACLGRVLSPPVQPSSAPQHDVLALHEDRGCPKVVAKRVLVTTDGSEAANRALPVALAAICTCDSTAVTLLRVLTPNSGSSPVHALDWALARAQAEAELRQLTARFENVHEHVETVVVEGRAAEQILHFIDTADIDLLVLASHGSNGAHAWTMGSVARKLVAGSRASVLIVPAQIEFRGIERVLVPLDCSTRAESVLPLLPKLAEVHDPEFVLAHVVPRPEISHRLPAGSRDLELVDELTHRNRRRAEAYLNDVHDRMLGRGVRARTVLLSDTSPARAIERYLAEFRADLVLLSAHGSGSHEGEAYGSIVRRLLDSLPGALWIVQESPNAGFKCGERSAGIRLDRA